MNLKLNHGPSTALIMDIGSGTQDILFYESGKELENCFKLVLPSPTQEKAQKIRKFTKQKVPLFLTGQTMGGGACVAAIKAHLKAGLAVYATKPAAKTINDNVTHIEDMGVILVEQPPEGIANITLEDVDIKHWQRFCELWSLKFPDRFAVAVQDHGESIKVSNRHFRMKRWRAFMDSGGFFEDLVYRSPPAELTRMQAVSDSIRGKTMLMDTGAAAVCGTLEDPEVAERQGKGVVIVNLGNSHTLIAIVQGARLIGICEHHTSMLTPSKLSDLINRLVAASISHQKVFDDGGHGVALARDFSGLSFSPMVTVTGPRRMLADSLNFYRAIPHGDMMLAGCFGLLRLGRQTGFIL